MLDDLDLSTIKNAQVLKKLLWNLNEEESSVLSHFKHKKFKPDIRINYKSSFMILSDMQVYKTYSILGILNNFKRNVKFDTLDVALLLSAWFNESEINKDSLLKNNILIVHGGFPDKFYTQYDSALSELISIRSSMMKYTWIFFENTSKDDLSINLPKTTKLLKKIMVVVF